MDICKVLNGIVVNYLTKKGHFPNNMYKFLYHNHNHYSISNTFAAIDGHNR